MAFQQMERWRATTPRRDEERLALGLERLGARLPRKLADAMVWLCVPWHRPVRIAVASGFILGSLFWFLPVLGLEMLPIGLALLAIDIPFLRAPVGRLLLWIDAKWGVAAAWWRRSTSRFRR